MFLFRNIVDGLEGCDNGGCLSVWHWANNDCIRVVVICNNKMYVFPLYEQHEKFPAKSICVVLFLVCTIAAKQKIVLGVSGLPPLELVCTYNYFPHVVGLAVHDHFCSDCLMCAFIVAIDTGRCLWTAVAVSPCQPVKW